MKDVFQHLVRLGLGVSNDIAVPKSIDWNKVEALAEQQGLLAIVLDGIEKLPDGQKSPKPVLMQWIGNVMQDEARYAVQHKAAIEMALLFHNNYIRTYVLKGEVVSECYPKPEHRVSSDMDCFLLPIQGAFDAWSLGNELVKSQGFEVGIGFYKNSTFYIPGLIVENHSYLTPFRGNKVLTNLERMLQAMLHQNKGEDRFEGTYLYRPPVMVSALFLIEHAYSHFLHEGLTWRMVLDWVLFSKKHYSEINWNDLDAYIDEFGFRKFYDSFSQMGKFLMGEMTEEELTIHDKKMLADLWAPLDLHDSLHGVKAKLQLAGNYWRARWKYKYFTEMTWIRALMEWVLGAVFYRNPELD